MVVNWYTDKIVKAQMRCRIIFWGPALFVRTSADREVGQGTFLYVILFIYLFVVVVLFVFSSWFCA